MDLSTSSGLASGAVEVVKGQLPTLLGLAEKTTSGVVSKVWEAILKRFIGNAAAQKAVADLKQGCNDEKRLAALRMEIEKVLENDPWFQDDLRGLLKKAGE